MYKKVYYLSTCNTCKRILSEIDTTEFELQDVKTTPIDLIQVEQLAQLAGTYESLLNRRARQYQERKLKEVALSEEDIKSLLLEHYTFLKRPVFVVDQQIFVGNSKNVIQCIMDNR